jgi:ADP-heptose:LPS heptosyltransferase
MQKPENTAGAQPDTQSDTQSDAQRLLITMPWGIGDAIEVGLSAVDQIMRNDPAGNVAIDLLCNRFQIEILAEDPRIHRLVEVDKRLFPTNEAGTWKRGFALSPEAAKLVEFLQGQGYTAVLPFMFAPIFFFSLRLPIMFLNVKEVWQVISRARHFQDTTIPTLIRRIIDKHFGKDPSDSELDAPIPLYIRPEHILQARQEVLRIKQQTVIPPEQNKLLLITPDTSSKITRPPTSLLAPGIAGALKSDPSLSVAILPSYSDEHASVNLLHALSPAFPGRLFLMPAEPKHPLLELAALIDQCDLFITGDTGLMHLAAAEKRITHAVSEELLPRNSVKIITIYGGTSPVVHAYRKRTIILGQGRKEQARIFPGMVKDLYNPKGKNLFDHIPPQQLTDAILGHREQSRAAA